jgi:aryl-alcohol dehydrogenase-like predicted oxidoreductase
MREDYFTQPGLDAVARLAPLAKEAGCTLSQLAIAWCLRRPEVTSAIVGATKREHVEDNVQAADLQIAPDLFDQMNAILAPVAAQEPYLS